MKRTFILAAIAVAAIVLVACNAETKGADQIKQDQQTVGTQQDIYTKGQPVPVFNYSQQRASLIEINAAIARGAATYSVFYSFGKPVFVCPSIGYPIPATTQLTNPQQVTRINTGSDHYVDGVIPQAEPVGTYTGDTAATYVLCVRSDGKAAPIYAEPDVIAFPFPVKIQDGVVVDAGGDASVKVEVKK